VRAVRFQVGCAQGSGGKSGESDALFSERTLLMLLAVLAAGLLPPAYPVCASSLLAAVPHMAGSVAGWPAAF